MNGVKLFHDWIMVRKIGGGPQQIRGIYLAEGAADSPLAEVVAVGDGTVVPGTGEVKPVGVKVGARVLFANESAPVLISGEQYFLIKEYQLIAEIDPMVVQVATVKDQALLTAATGGRS